MIIANGGIDYFTANAQKRTTQKFLVIIPPRETVPISNMDAHLIGRRYALFMPIGCIGEKPH